MVPGDAKGTILRWIDGRKRDLDRFAQRQFRTLAASASIEHELVQIKLEGGALPARGKPFFGRRAALHTLVELPTPMTTAKQITHVELNTQQFYRGRITLTWRLDQSEDGVRMRLRGSWSGGGRPSLRVLEFEGRHGLAVKKRRPVVGRVGRGMGGGKEEEEVSAGPELDDADQAAMIAQQEYWTKCHLDFDVLDELRVLLCPATDCVSDILDLVLAFPSRPRVVDPHNPLPAAADGSMNTAAGGDGGEEEEEEGEGEHKGGEEEGGAPAMKFDGGEAASEGSSESSGSSSEEEEEEKGARRRGEDGGGGKEGDKEREVEHELREEDLDPPHGLILTRLDPRIALLGACLAELCAEAEEEEIAEGIGLDDIAADVAEAEAGGGEWGGANGGGAGGAGSDHSGKGRKIVSANKFKAESRKERREREKAARKEKRKQSSNSSNRSNSSHSSRDSFAPNDAPAAVFPKGPPCSILNASIAVEDTRRNKPAAGDDDKDEEGKVDELGRWADEYVER